MTSPATGSTHPSLTEDAPEPQMKPVERLGWALLWTATTAVMATAFYYLVAEPTL